VKAQVALGVIAALALVACGHVDQGATESPTEGRTDQSSIESPKEGLADFLECMRQIQHDYEPADTPAALAAESDAVVTGTIVALRPGQSYAALWKTSVLEVRVAYACPPAAASCVGPPPLGGPARLASWSERKCASKRPGRAESAFAELTYVGRRLPRAPRGTTSRWAQSQWI
jgi:hypothetical protein